MNPAAQQAEKAADRLRDEFLVTLRELDRRRQRALDVKGLLRDNRRVVLAAAGGVVAVVALVAGTSAALSHRRDARLASRRLDALGRAWRNPERLATRAGDLPRPLGLAAKLLSAAVLAAGTQVIRRSVQRALPSP